ncbi:formylglycine-generating enzyme family protein [Tautonia plasticadhaerens]|uniref:Serine/threonine-protein kinase pkn1 n=1 Tax=Tautonia plasticadhaerens TaxID=2527974 RepID=A0A518H5C1_9BACT|nr:formylglycine-generating enzyme family protein [Tautonia plasticadhaerens]QDV36008.1 Serine/threonine-protein kinase pkn1 [Tautonia plasticadhaerens]
MTIPLSIGRAGAVAASCALLLAVSPARGQDAKSPEEMKPYTETIPGTDISFEMVPIPGGTFTMGSPEDEPDRMPHEGPQHPVTVGPFWMGKHEVTWDEYDEFAFSFDLRRKEREGVKDEDQPDSELAADAITRPTPPYADETFGLGREGQPVICITWHSAMEYCRWLSAKTGHTYRLPTEAEWEYACRAGTTTAYHFGDDPELLEEYDWFFENCEGPQPVGTGKPNPWGLYDMHGNVAEWVLDHYVADLYSRRSQDSPTVRPVVVPDEFEFPYVARGGSWDYDPWDCRSASRHVSDPIWSVQDPQRPQSIWWHTDATFVGFRIVRAFDEQPELVGLQSKMIKGKGPQPSGPGGD